MIMDPEKFQDLVQAEICQFVANDPRNRLHELDNTEIFQAPLVGFVTGDDPIFTELKSVIGTFHLTPREAMTKKYKKTSTRIPKAKELGVISYILPIAEVTREENARMTDRPSPKWAHTRLYGQQFNDALQVHLVEFLEARGFLAVAPEQTPRVFRQKEDSRVGWTSNWSHRHIAYAAGLGTFGLSDGLITSVGKAHRTGSIVVNHRVTSITRPQDIHAGCLYFRDGSCKQCLERCPVGAISGQGHDKKKCGEFVFSQVPYIREQYGIPIYACGLCQCGVPCEKKDPVRSSLSQ